MTIMWSAVGTSEQRTYKSRGKTHVKTRENTSALVYGRTYTHMIKRYVSFQLAYTCSQKRRFLNLSVIWLCNVVQSLVLPPNLFLAFNSVSSTCWSNMKKLAKSTANIAYRRLRNRFVTTSNCVQTCNNTCISNYCNKGGMFFGYILP